MDAVHASEPCRKPSDVPAHLPDILAARPKVVWLQVSADIILHVYGYHLSLIGHHNAAGTDIIIH